MRAADYLAAAQALPIGTLDDLTGGKGVVVVAPHPDDESLGCGGLIATAVAQGRAVRIVIVSDGVGSHPNSPSYPPARLRALREDEARAAAARLGVAAQHVSFLRLPDRFVPTTGPEAQAAIQALQAIVREAAAGAVFVTWAHDPHGDHVASAALAASAVRGLPGIRLYAYPIWGWTLPAGTEVGGPPVGLRLAIGEHLAAKRAAIAEHRSQVTGLIDDDPTAFRLTPTIVRFFEEPFEIFIETGQ